MFSLFRWSRPCSLLHRDLSPLIVAFASDVDDGVQSLLQERAPPLQPSGRYLRRRGNCARLRTKMKDNRSKFGRPSKTNATAVEMSPQSQALLCPLPVPLESLSQKRKRLMSHIPHRAVSYCILRRQLSLASPRFRRWHQET